MDPLEPERLSDDECMSAFSALFPQGLGGDDVIAELAPDGWEHTPLLAVFHPSVEQRHREAVQLHRNVERLIAARRTGPPRPEPTLEEIRREWRAEPVDVGREIRELVGRCLWDVFSDNHDVIAPDGRIVDIGSFRGAGGFIADLLNGEIRESRYDYMDFYMGTVWVRDRADLTPVYATIFRRLARHGYDWRYVFPRLYAIELGGGDESADLAERIERDRRRAELRAELEAGHRDALEAAKDQAPPDTVVAYRLVHGDDPRGWPPPD